MIQNEPTGRMVKVTRATGRSSDYLGPCEICSKKYARSIRSTLRKERKRANGEVYIDKSGGSTYGHRECLLQLVNVKPDILALNISSGTSKESNFLLALGLNPKTMIFYKKKPVNDRLI